MIETKLYFYKCISGKIIRVLLFFKIFIFQLNLSILGINWYNKTGLDKNGINEKVLFWTSLNDNYYDVGYFNYADIHQIYAGLDYATDNFELQAGHLNKSLLNGFILSHGEFMPGENSTPDKKPVGFSLKLTENFLSLYSGSYFNIIPKEYYSYSVENNIHIQSAAINLHLLKWSLETGGAISTTRVITPEKFLDYPDGVFDPFFYFNIYNMDWIKVQSLYSQKYGWLGIINFTTKNLFLDLFLMSVKNKNPFAARLYDVNRHYYVSLRYTYFKIKIYDQENSVRSRAMIKINNFGLYSYINQTNNIIGIFHLAENASLSPYAAIYVTPNANVIMNSLGINYKNEWLFTLVHSQNKSQKYYPYDPQIIPDRFYYSGVSLDSETSYNHSYLGFQFYWNLEPFFCYVSILQNYFEKQDDNIAVTARLEYNKTF